MKKLTFVAGAILGLMSSAAMAQSTVTVYGILDAGINSVSNLKGGNSLAVVSGIMDGSRFGLRGTEDLGGGYSASFTMENRFELDNGAMQSRPLSGSQLPDRLNTATLLGLPASQQATVTAIANTIGGTLGVNLGNNLFDRQVFVGLTTPVGRITVGRQYTPGFLTMATFDASSAQSSLQVAGVGSLVTSPVDTRANNSIQYAIQKDGTTAAFMYAPGEVVGNDDAGRFYGAMASYRTKAFAVGLGYNTRNNDVGKTSLTTTVIGASGGVGPGTVFAQWMSVVDDNPSVSTLPAPLQATYTQALRQDANVLHVGYKMTTGASTWVVAYSRYDDNKAANSDTTTYGVTHTYAFSKRTSLNTVLTQVTNDGLAQTAPGQAGFAGGFTSKAGEGSTNIAFGINHKF